MSALALDVAPGIVVLLDACSPSAIARLVVPIVVDSIDGEPSGLFAHVGEKVFERIPPAVTDLDPAPAVVLPAFSLVVSTPGDHVTPDVVGRRPGIAVRDLFHALFAGAIAPVTAATLGVIAAQGSSADVAIDTAITPAMPDVTDFGSDLCGALYHLKPAEALTGKVVPANCADTPLTRGVDPQASTRLRVPTENMLSSKRTRSAAIARAHDSTPLVGLPGNHQSSVSIPDHLHTHMDGTQWTYSKDQS